MIFKLQTPFLIRINILTSFYRAGTIRTISVKNIIKVVGAFYLSIIKTVYCQKKRVEGLIFKIFFRGYILTQNKFVCTFG